MQFLDQSTGTVHEWLWGFGDGSTSSEQYPTHTYDTDGVYQVCLLVQDTINQCNSVYCQELMVGVVNTRDLSQQRELLIFPNPARRANPQWILEGWYSADYGKELELSLIDIQGRILEQQPLTIEQKTSFRVEGGLAAGIYLLQVRSENGIYMGKLIVQ